MGVWQRTSPACWELRKKAMSRGRRYQSCVGRQMLCTQSRERCNHAWLQALAHEPGKALSDLSNLLEMTSKWANCGQNSLCYCRWPCGYISKITGGGINSPLLQTALHPFLFCSPLGSPLFPLGLLTGIAKARADFFRISAGGFLKAVPKLGQVWTWLIPIPTLNFKFRLAEHGALELSKAKAARISRMWKKGTWFFIEVIKHFGHANKSSKGREKTGAHTFMG